MTHEKRLEEALEVNGIKFTHDDIFRVVDDFYRRIQHDPILKKPFSSVENWTEHIERLTHFWWIRFGGKSYLEVSYDPVTKHFFAGFNREFLTRWLFLFNETLQKNLTDEQAVLWKTISERMGEALTMKNDFFRSEYESREQEFRTDSRNSQDQHS